LTFLGSSLA
jgi:hypothetical protein